MLAFVILLSQKRLLDLVHITRLKKAGINLIPFCPDFYILPAHFRIFGQIRNQYEIWDVKFENRTETVWPVSQSFPYFPYLIGMSLFH